MEKIACSREVVQQPPARWLGAAITAGVLMAALLSEPLPCSAACFLIALWRQGWLVWDLCWLTPALPHSKQL